MASTPFQEKRWISIAADVTAFVLTATAVVITRVLAVLVEPTVAGFYCDDRAIRFPYRPSTVPDWALIFASIAVPLTAVKPESTLTVASRNWRSFIQSCFFFFLISDVSRCLVRTFHAAQREPICAKLPPLKLASPLCLLLNVDVDRSGTHHYCH